MANQVITVDRKKYATGLFWQPVAAGFLPRNYARNLAHNVDGHLGLFVDYRAMVGLGSRRVGHRRGMHSAAAEIMDALTEYTSFMGVFAVGGGVFYLVAARNGIILQDKLFTSETQAREAYLELTQIPDWSALFAPASWSMPRAVERPLDEVIRGNAPAGLRYISQFRVGLVQVLLIAAFVAGVWYLFQDPIKQMIAPRPAVSTIDPELAAEYKRQIEEKNKELDEAFNIKQPPPPPPLVLPYDYLPDVTARAEMCYRAIAFLMQPVTGWNQTQASCGEEYADVTFKRNFGTIGGFYEAATNLMPGGLVREASENLLTVRAKLPSVKTGASRDERDAETIVRDVTSLFQGINTTADINVVSDTVSNGVDSVVLDIVEIAASSKLTPMAFMEIFNDFGGVYMPRCTWDVTKRIWNYEVIIYAK